ncbi:TPA: DUF1090 family protein [Escherichia coli]|nr:DUF1090 family protein [Escherichia coli]HBA7046360.1 DUF1090 family protein [Escherichia coli]HBA7645628.1 DUF1090 family protein [Escherichia coli]HBA7654734.1 DUF1090 family protein [Escherichia coli]HBA7728235.1 DUF1090 family protein [Escherichia coli]
MELAKNYSNWHRLQELQRALQRIEKNCNNSILIITDTKKTEESFKAVHCKEQLEFEEKHNIIKETQQKKEN